MCNRFRSTNPATIPAEKDTEQTENISRELWRKQSELVKEIAQKHMLGQDYVAAEARLKDIRDQLDKMHREVLTASPSSYTKRGRRRQQQAESGDRRRTRRLPFMEVM